MLIVAEKQAEGPVGPGVTAGLAEEIERQEREDDARGPEPEARRAVLRAGWWREVAAVPSLPAGYLAADAAGAQQEPGADEIRARALL
ncbi:hypothetical protein ACWGK9_34490, partial [Streptomyces rubiginosohelvolus]